MAAQSPGIVSNVTACPVHRAIGEAVRIHAEVLQADRVTGEDGFIVRCAIAEPEDLQTVVDALAQQGAVTTSLVLSSPVHKVSTVHALKGAGHGTWWPPVCLSPAHRALNEIWLQRNKDGGVKLLI